MKEKYALYAGIIGPIIGIGAVLLSVILSSSWFSWQENALSDLGVDAFGGTAAGIWTFNLGMIIAGVLSSIYAYGLYGLLTKNTTNKIGIIALIIGGINLALVGIFTEDWPTIHRLVAMTYFVFTPIGLIIMGSGMLKKERTFGIITTIAGISALISISTAILIVFQVPVTEGWPAGIAIPEMVEAVIMAAWISGSALKFLKNKGSK